MIYLTGVHALNIEDSLNTCGDWHTSALNWSALNLRESNGSILGDWGIEINKKIPEHSERYNVANTLRAILDIMQDDNILFLKGFYNDFICTDEYNNIFFEKVLLLRKLKNWHGINKLMEREFMFKWLKYKEERGII